MIGLPSGTQVWLIAGATDMRRGFDGLAAIVQTKLASNPYGGQVFVFRGRRGDRIKVLWWDGHGLCLLCKRLEKGYFVWPQADSGSVHLERGTAVHAARRHRLAAPAADPYTARGLAQPL
ncbi:MAG: IS66 family insertion sequence element accessory protein TnpB [Janthinobacterium lividum]